ncbi:MAG TPA: MBL fold metallo-hydrolase [Roseiarcus sp.]|nr:MBL fold metallo-hydrolase [Roseiarcus sp.]
MTGDDDLTFDAEDAEAGAVKRVSPLVRRLIANNPSPFTFTGTCSYVIGQGSVAIVDPGPLDEAHIAALLDAIRGESVRHILVTHTHRDHSPAAARLKAATGAAILGARPFAPKGGVSEGKGLDAAHDLHYAPDHALSDGERVAGPGYTLETVATPGHAANHLCFALVEENSLFSGDHVMGWSTTVVAPPDGSMSAYMASLEKLRSRGESVFWPGHGGPVRNPQRYMRGLAHHRRQREAAILARIEAGDQTIDEIVAAIYVGLDARLVGAAKLSTLAHLQDLVERGLVTAEGTLDLNGRYHKPPRSNG